MIVLDTSVISEMMKPMEQRSQAVAGWLARQAGEELFTTTVTAAEILAGVSIMPRGKRQATVAEAAERVLGLFSGRLLGFDPGAARRFADAIAVRRRAGKSINSLDLLIGAVASVHGMAVATRNTSDFEDTGVEVINPWDA